MLVMVMSIKQSLMDAELSAQRPLGNEAVHWKDVVRMLLYHVAFGEHWDAFFKNLGVPSSTAHTIIGWILKFTKYLSNLSFYLIH
jgi:hypothetical protein